MSNLEKALDYLSEAEIDLYENLSDEERVHFDALFDAARRWLHRLTSPETKVWLCREGDERIVNWVYGATGDPHCWFNGPREHNPECGPHLVVPLDTEPPKEKL